MENFKSVQSTQNGNMNPYVLITQLQHFRILPFLYHRCFHLLPTPT